MKVKVRERSLKSMFGTRIANSLKRNGVNSIEDLRELDAKYPIEEWFGYSGHWRGIGPGSYEKVKKYLKRDQG